MTPTPTVLHISLFLKANLLDLHDRSVLFNSLILTLHLYTREKLEREILRHRQMKPLFFKCHDSKT